jgi:hypothetical protein
MRDLITQDVFAMVKIISKMGLKENLKEFASKVAEMNNKNSILKAIKESGAEDENLKQEIISIQTEIGLMIPVIFLENFDKAEKEIQKFIAGITEVPLEEFLKSKAEDTLDIIMELKESEQFKSFFTKALKLLK